MFGGRKIVHGREMNASLTPVPRTLSMYFDRIDHADLDVVDRVGDPRRMVEMLSFATLQNGGSILKLNQIDTNEASKGKCFHSGLLNIIQERSCSLAVNFPECDLDLVE